ncbi:MAG TPA: TolC family protein [Candidatus Binatia bacterium]|nr:TolC family protein [Candidatus Binatia bacterium]
MRTTALLPALFAYSVFALSPAPTYAQQSIDFATAVELARKNNPDWRAAEQDVQAARGRVTTARLISPFNPAIETQAGPRRMPGEGTGTDVGVGLSMEVEIAGQRAARITEAENNLKKAEAGFQNFIRTFRAKIARAFYHAVLARERLALQRRIENLNRTVLNVTNTKFQAGDVSGLEVNLAAVRFGQVRKDTFDAERDLRQSIAELRRLIGAEQTYLPEGKLDATAPVLAEAAALQTALSSRPDLMARRYELQRVEAEIALLRRQVLPNPIFGLSFNREGSGDKTVLAGITVPLPVFNRRQGELESLEARRLQARAELLALEKDIHREVAQALDRWETARQSAELFQREVMDKIDENFRLIQTAYREGRLDLPQLLVMENNLIAANQSYLEVLSSLREAAIQIEEVTGEVR